MSLGFGTTSELPRQKYVFESLNKPKARTTTSLISFLRIFIVVVEVGLSLLPGVGTAAQVGIGLGAAAANTALSAVSGSLSGIGIGIDFAAAFVPAFGDLNFARKVTKITGSDLTKTLQVSTIETEQALGEASALRNLQRGLNSARINAGRATKLQAKAVNESKRLASRIAKGEISNEEKAAIEIAFIEEKAASESTIAFRKQAEVLRKYGVDQNVVLAKMEEWSDTFEKIKGFKFAQKVNRNKFISELEKAGGAERLEVLKQIYVEPLRRKGANALTALKVSSQVKITNTLSHLSEESQSIFNLFLRRLNYISMTKKQISEEVKLLIDSIEKINKNDFNILSNLSQEEFSQAFGVFGRNADPNAVRKWIKKLGSKEFNDKFVQRAQLIDPNDIGRYPVELTYQHLKDKFNKYLEKKAVASASKAGKKVLRSSESLDKAFFKSGGKLIGKGEKGSSGFIASRYILGIKKMPGGIPTKRAVLVKFNKTNTKSRTGKNSAGKQDILVTMSDLDFERLQIEGTGYWFSVGRKRGWFVSRGGRRAGSSASTISNEMSLFLGFVPIPALRNLLSIVSNWVENIADMSRGTYFHDFIPKLERAFVRSAVNRSARLASRVIVGGYTIRGARRLATKAVTKEVTAMSEQLGMEATHPEFQALIREAAQKAGRKSAWIGRELQRFATSTLSTFEGKTKSGYFTFTDGSSKSGSGLHNLGKKLIMTAAPTSAKGAMLRHGTRTGKIRGRQLVGSQRYFGQIGRIYGALTPAGTVKPLRSITKIHTNKSSVGF